MSRAIADVIVLGAGAAGLMSAGVAGRRGRSVIVLEQAQHPGEKMRISGGGRCNFTNLHTTPANFLSQKSAVLPFGAERLHPARFHRDGGAPPHRLSRKPAGNCSATARPGRSSTCCSAECRASDVALRLRTKITAIAKTDGSFTVSTDRGACCSRPRAGGRHRRAVDPEMSASGYVGSPEQFGLSIVPPRAAPGAADLHPHRCWRSSPGCPV